MSTPLPVASSTAGTTKPSVPAIHGNTDANLDLSITNVVSVGTTSILATTGSTDSYSYEVLFTPRRIESEDEGIAPNLYEFFNQHLLGAKLSVARRQIQAVESESHINMDENMVSRNSSAMASVESPSHFPPGFIQPRTRSQSVNEKYNNEQSAAVIDVRVLDGFSFPGNGCPTKHIRFGSTEQLRIISEEDGLLVESSMASEGSASGSGSMAPAPAPPPPPPPPPPGPALTPAPAPPGASAAVGAGYNPGPGFNFNSTKSVIPPELRVRIAQRLLEIRDIFLEIVVHLRSVGFGGPDFKWYPESLLPYGITLPPDIIIPKAFQDFAFNRKPSEAQAE